jgi:hypothetical protein
LRKKIIFGTKHYYLDDTIIVKELEMGIEHLIGGLILLVLILMNGWLGIYNKNKKLERENIQLQDDCSKVLSQKKSSEVRLGKIGENMAPFFKDWPFDPNDFRFLGNPVDGIQFNEDEVVFIEIKTGKARLTSSQKSVKQLVKEGKVKFVTFRVGEDGCTLKVEE